MAEMTKETFASELRSRCGAISGPRRQPESVVAQAKL